MRPRCPSCGSGNTRRYGFLPVRVYRALAGRHTKWRCRDCKIHFRGQRTRKHIQAALIVCGVLFSLLLCDFINTALISSPREWLKRKTVMGYQWYYGPGPLHKRKMHEHLGVFFGGVRDEMDEYAGHNY